MKILSVLALALVLGAPAPAAFAGDSAKEFFCGPNKDCSWDQTGRLIEDLD
ncbi:MAG: hypothetical protein V6Z81_10365 [Parvularculales bacterium]